MFDRLNARLRKLPGNAYNQRWGVWTTMLLKASDGDVYLFRRRVFQTPACALYLHDIYEGDEIVDFGHSHPFCFISVILRGGYTEKLWWTDGKNTTRTGSKSYRRFGVNVMPRGASKVHTITECDPTTKTLVFAGRRKDSWGWFVEGRGVVHWSQFLVEQGSKRGRV